MLEYVVQAELPPDNAHARKESISSEAMANAASLQQQSSQISQQQQPLSSATRADDGADSGSNTDIAPCDSDQVSVNSGDALYEVPSDMVEGVYQDPDECVMASPPPTPVSDNAPPAADTNNRESTA